MYIAKFTATAEQIQYAHSALQRSLAAGYKDKFNGKQKDTALNTDLRFRGFLGEVLFADAYGLPRPKECFGIAGQDYGKDFVLGGCNFDVKTVKLKTTPTAARNVSFILPDSMIDAPKSVTEYYFFIAIIETSGGFDAYLCGSISAAKIKARTIGTAYKAGDKLHFGRGTANDFVFHNDCLRLNIGEIVPVKITPKIEKLPNFAQVEIA
jgi:hypothetical protein